MAELFTELLVNVEKHCRKTGFPMLKFDIFKAKIIGLEARVKELRAAAEAYQDYATCYRLAQQVSEKLWKRLDKAREALKGGEEK